ncbi:PHD finger protein 14-like [Salvelinus namaycush]|uniref:PHD finger protein 14-like n=1 Tax=Salvelinus namaycush TaxID=8040 RepID=A0A8U0PL14_SALNM|nr:PHD finger protein 14-like [Salvelinus namaycush]
MDRGSKRRQVKPLAASLLDALDYDSSDDSDFEVGDADASGSEGSAIGSDEEEEGSKEESAAEDSDNDSGSDNIGSAADGIDEEQTKELTGDDTPTEEEEKTKEQQLSYDSSTTTTKDPAPSGVPRGRRRREEKASDTEAGSGGSGSGTGSGNAQDGGSTTAATQEPKKWNLRRNRPMLDFTTMDELNEMDDYDSEDDNDWRPAAGKKKGKTAAAQKGGSEGEEDEEDHDGGSGSDDDDDNEDDDGGDENENEEGSSSDSDKEVKKPKRKVKSSSVFDEELTNDSMSQGKSNEDALLERAQTWSAAAQRMEHILICCVCLGDNSEDADEIIQCDNCGVTVHEGCYGVDGESDSIMSSASENSTEPWFCDACKNGVTPSCELCPNQDGIFKETDAGRWVHVVCALYVPGVAFGDIDKLRPVTLTEMNYSKYGAKECSFCEDARFARTGVCISCDAGMCRSYFHVTCAQREGLLSEAAAEEDIADPFFAYCKQHADRYDRKWKRKNYLALQSYCKASLQDKEKQLAPEAQARITTRLQQYRARAELSRNTRPQAWVPREKLPRPLTSSASAIRKLMRKAELMGISTDIFPVDTSDISASVDGRRKHKQPALTADFVNYYLEQHPPPPAISHQNNIPQLSPIRTTSPTPSYRPSEHPPAFSHQNNIPQLSPSEQHPPAISHQNNIPPAISHQNNIPQLSPIRTTPPSYLPSEQHPPAISHQNNIPQLSPIRTTSPSYLPSEQHPPAISHQNNIPQLSPIRTTSLSYLPSEQHPPPPAIAHQNNTPQLSPIRTTSPSYAHPRTTSPSYLPSEQHPPAISSEQHPPAIPSENIPQLSPTRTTSPTPSYRPSEHPPAISHQNNIPHPQLSPIRTTSPTPAIAHQNNTPQLSPIRTTSPSYLPSEQHPPAISHQNNIPQLSPIRTTSPSYRSSEQHPPAISHQNNIPQLSPIRNNIPQLSPHQNNIPSYLPSEQHPPAISQENTSPIPQLSPIRTNIPQLSPIRTTSPPPAISIRTTSPPPSYLPSEQHPPPPAIAHQNNTPQLSPIRTTSPSYRPSEQHPPAIAHQNNIPQLSPIRTTSPSYLPSEQHPPAISHQNNIPHPQLSPIRTTSPIPSYRPSEHPPAIFHQNNIPDRLQMIPLSSLYLYHSTSTFLYLPLLLRQCSECDQASSDDADIAMETLPDGTKRSRRQIKGPIKFIPQEMSPEPKKRDVRGTRTRGQKRKRVSICEEERFEVQEPALRERRQRQSVMQKKTPKADDTRTDCTSCKGPGDNENLVRCDECCLCYHFGCLDPPLKKSPKQTGYGWICQECDTSSSKEEEEEHEEDEEDDSFKEETTEHDIPTEIPN